MAAPTAQPAALPFADDEVAVIRLASPGCSDDLIHLNQAGSSLPVEAVLDAQLTSSVKQ